MTTQEAFKRDVRFGFDVIEPSGYKLAGQGRRQFEVEGSATGKVYGTWTTREDAVRHKATLDSMAIREVYGTGGGDNQ